MRASLCPALTWCAPRHIAHSHHPPAHTCCSRTHNHQPAERDNQSNSNQNKFHAHTLALARLRAWRTSIELTTNTGGAGQTMPAPGNPRSKHTHPQRKALHPPRPVGGEAARAINGTILRRATPGLPACSQAARQQPRFVTLRRQPLGGGGVGNGSTVHQHSHQSLPHIQTNTSPLSPGSTTISLREHAQPGLLHIHSNLKLKSQPVCRSANEITKMYISTTKLLSSHQCFFTAKARTRTMDRFCSHTDTSEVVLGGLHSTQRGQRGDVRAIAARPRSSTVCSAGPA